MKKIKKNLIKLKTNNSNHFYIKKKSKKISKTTNKKINLSKYDPFLRKHTLYIETKIK